MPEDLRQAEQVAASAAKPGVPTASTKRLSAVEFVVDRLAPFRDILAGLPEAKETCAAGCNMYGIADLASSYTQVYATKPRPQQLAKPTGCDRHRKRIREGVAA
jgi:hypothetical protein